MNIAIMCHNRKQELMVQFCTAYCGVLSKHTVCATNATGRMVAEAIGLPVLAFPKEQEYFVELRLPALATAAAPGEHHGA